MRKKPVALVLTACAAACLFAGCTVQATQEELENLQNPPSIENGEYENGYLAGFAQDEGMTIDGVLDEDVWQNNGTAYTFEHEMSTQNNPVSMTTMSYLGEHGLYVAFDVADAAIYYSADRRASGNTSVELYVAAVDRTEWDGNAFRISVVPTGNDSCTTEMRTYRTRTAVYQGAETLNAEWSLWNKAHIAGCHIEGMGINTSSNEGYAIELFIPWESLGLEETPDMVQYMTAFYHCESAASDAANVWTKCDPNAGSDALGSWLVATNDAIGTYAQMADPVLVPTDPSMTVDGRFDEDAWDLSGEFVYSVNSSSYGGVQATVGTTAHMTDMGLYLAVRVRDGEIYASPSRAINLNSSIELWVQTADAAAVNPDSVQMRVDALGNISKYCGRESNDFYAHYFRSVAAVTLLGCETQDGVVATNSATGFDVELFIPWTELGLSEKPESVAVYPQYIHTENITNTARPSSNTEDWSFWQLSNQTTAKTNSQNGFARLTEGGYPSDLVAQDVLFNASDLAAGAYTTQMEIVREYTGTISNSSVSLVPARAVGVTSQTQGAQLAANEDGTYTLTLSAEFVGSIDEYKAVNIQAGGDSASFTALYLPAVADGRVTEAEYTSLPVGFYVVNNRNYGASAVIYTTAGEYGVAFAIVMNCDYINTQGTTEGNNGGGIELRMAAGADASAAAQAETGLWWRVFADGTARTNTVLTKGSPSSSRTTSPVGSLAFAVGTVAADSGSGYKQMTVEFYVPYSAVGAAGADDFYFALGLIPTNPENNASMVTAWMDGTSQDGATPPAAAWLQLADLASAQLPQNVSVNALFGEATFRMQAQSVSSLENVYFPGVSFTGGDGSTVIEEEDGWYAYTARGTSGTTLTATLGTGSAASTAQVTFTYYAPPVTFDGTVDDGDEYANIPYTFYVKNSNDMEVTVYAYYDDYGVSIALVLQSDYINVRENDSSVGGGGFEVRIANATDATTGLWWRLFADGSSRSNTNLTQGSPLDRTTEDPTGTLAYAVGLVPNEGDDLTTAGYNRMTVEFFVPYSAVGATGASDFYIAVGANDTQRTANNNTMAVRWMDGSSTTVPAAQNWLTAANIVAAGPADVTADAFFGNASFRIGSALSEYVYFRGAAFGEASVTEGEYGYYSYTMSGTAQEQLTATVGGKSATVTLNYTAVDGITIDGKVDENDHYANIPYTFYAVNGHEMEITVYVYYDNSGVSIALVHDTDRIGVSETETNAGGGFELKMANATNATQGLYWRMFADGSSRSNVYLSGFNDTIERTTEKPMGSFAYAVGTVAADSGNGYKQMTAEFFVPYSAVCATGANNFYIAVGAIATLDSDNTSRAVRWMNNSATIADDCWLTIADIVAAQPADSIVTAVNGGASFRVGSELSEYVYYKGATFGEADVTEGEFGYYSYTMSGTEAEALTATVGNATAQIALTYEIGQVLDGKISTGEYEHSFSFEPASGDMVTIRWTQTADAIYIAFDVVSSEERTLTNTSSGNQGSAGVNFVVSTVNSDSTNFGDVRNYYRAYASGLVRMRANFTTTGTFAPDSTPTTLDYMVGSHVVESGETESGITEYVLEWQISYADYGVESADDLYFLFGWMTSGGGDRGYGKVSGLQTINTGSLSSIVFDFSEYMTLADMLALEAAQGGQETQA